jgi:hypothetical protein
VTALYGDRNSVVSTVLSARVTITRARPIARADVASSLHDATTDPRRDGRQGIQLTGT